MRIAPSVPTRRAGRPRRARALTGLAVVAVSALGALIGIKIARELKKSGVLKK